MVARCSLETCLFEWNQHLEGVQEWIAKGLDTSTENVQFYKFSLLRNEGQVENQSLHHDCTTPTVLQEAENSSVQDGLEEKDNDEEDNW